MQIRIVICKKQEGLNFIFRVGWRSWDRFCERPSTVALLALPVHVEMRIKLFLWFKEVCFDLVPWNKCDERQGKEAPECNFKVYVQLSRTKYQKYIKLKYV